MPATRRRPKAYFTEHAVADRFAPAMRRVVLEAIQGSRRRLSLDSFTARWSQGPEAIFNALPWRQLELDWFDGWRAALLPTVQAAMRAQLMNLRIEKASEPVSQLGFSLDLTNPRAIRWAEEHAAELVVQLSEETKANLRRTIADMYIKGVSPREAMRILQRQLGLSARDGRALEGLRHRLEIENATRIVDPGTGTRLPATSGHPAGMADHARRAALRDLCSPGSPQPAGGPRRTLSGWRRLAGHDAASAPTMPVLHWAGIFRRRREFPPPPSLSPCGKRQTHIR